MFASADCSFKTHMYIYDDVMYASSFIQLYQVCVHELAMVIHVSLISSFDPSTELVM